MTEIKKIGVLSAAKVYAAMGAVGGLFVGAFMTLLGATAKGSAGGLLAGIGVLAIIILPVIYAILCFVLGAVGAFLYNVIAQTIGGVEVETK
jgi:hypothetical protein